MSIWDFMDKHWCVGPVAMVLVCGYIAQTLMRWAPASLARQKRRAEKKKEKES